MMEALLGGDAISSQLRPRAWARAVQIKVRDGGMFPAEEQKLWWRNRKAFRTTGAYPAREGPGEGRGWDKGRSRPCNRDKTREGSLALSPGVPGRPECF